MKRQTILTALLTLVVVAAGYGLVQAHGSQSRGGSGGSWSGMGGGHMGGYGWDHMGSGGHMMGSGGHMTGPGAGWDGMGRGMQNFFNGNGFGTGGPRRDEHPVTRDQARRIIEHRLGDNPRIRIGGVNETRDGFEFEIVTKKGEELVDRMFVERETGHTYPVIDR